MNRYALVVIIAIPILIIGSLLKMSVDDKNVFLRLSKDIKYVFGKFKSLIKRKGENSEI